MNTNTLTKLQALWSKPSIKASKFPPITSPLPTPPNITSESPSDLQARLEAAWLKPRINTKTAISTSTEPSIAPLPAPITINNATTTPLPIFVDVETRSHCDLTIVGVKRYAHDPTTELVSLVAMIDGVVVVWTPGRELTTVDQLWPETISTNLPMTLFSGPDLPEVLADAIRAGRPFCAHNAFGFDSHVWRAQGLLEPREWVDTLPMARAAGLPGSLDELGERLFGIGKDKAGSKVLHSIMKPGKDGQLPPITPEQLATLVKYNIQDVALLVGVHAKVAGCGEPDVIRLDSIINQRGVAFDCELAAKLIELEEASLMPLCQAMDAATGGAVKQADLRRTKFLGDWLRDHRADLKNLRRETVENFLATETNINPEVRAVLDARLAISRITRSKLETAVNTCDPDGRLRNTLIYHKALTGRWAGRGTQPHNLPRPHHLLGDISGLLSLVDQPDKFVSALPPGVSTADALSAMIRPCFRARPRYVLVLADFAGVEARATAWCAGEQRQLERFAAGEDNYLDLAATIFGREVTAEHKRERAVGKVAVLGCGYQMGADKFAKGCIDKGVNLAAANTSPEAVVEAYRDRYPAIAGAKNGRGWREEGLWQNLENAARSAIRGQGIFVAGKCTFVREGSSLIVVLPSGRRMYYQNARLERGRKWVNGDAKFESARPSIAYDSPKAKGVTVYGGKFTENIASGICRDLLVNSMLECERQELPIVLTVHDEIVLELPEADADEALRRLLVIMSTPPAWAMGFPIEVEGFWSERYFKAPPSGSQSLRARQGELLSANA